MLKTLKSLSSEQLKDKKVLVRVDFNVPLKNGEIQDQTRLISTLPSLRFLLDHGAKVILLTHLGRPDGQVLPEYRVDPIAKALSQLLDKPVPKLDDCVGKGVQHYVDGMQGGDIVLLENTRFYPQEEANDFVFSQELANLGDLFVNDAFGTLHRAHASTVGVAKILPSYAGFLVEKEVETLSRLIQNPERPLCLVIGGAKIDTKIGILEHFLDLADVFLIGGALANTFLAAQGYSVGASLYERDKLDTAKCFLELAQEKNVAVLLPEDVVVAESIPPSASPSHLDLNSISVAGKILDIGEKTIQSFTQEIQRAKTILWNGPLGLYEYPEFQKGTQKIAEAIAQAGVTRVIGGGDTIDAIHHFNLPEEAFTHISTGGGAMLEFLEGKILPGVEVLENRT